MKNPKVSIIIPIYNTEKYIASCLDSIINQTFEDIEIICVNDGSTDNTRLILEDYSKKDKRIKLFSQDNQGPSSARNNGIQKAQGKYIQFVDSDDELELDTIETLYKKSGQSNLDIVMFNIRPRLSGIENKKHYKAFVNYYKRNKTYTEITNGTEMFYKMLKDNNFLPSPVTYMTRAKLIKENKIRFYEGIIHEDNLFTIQLLLSASRVKHINKNFYIRNVRSDSIMTTKVGIKNLNGYFITIRELMKLEKNFNLNRKITEEFSKYISSSLHYNFLNFIEKIPKDNVDLYRKNLDTESVTLFDLLTTNHFRKNNYIKKLKKQNKLSRYEKLSLKAGKIIFFLPWKGKKLLRKIFKNLKRDLRSIVKLLNILFNENYIKFKRYYRNRFLKAQEDLNTVFLFLQKDAVELKDLQKINKKMNYSYYLQPCKFIKNKYSLHLVCQNKTYINNNTDVNKKIKNRSKTLFYSLKNNNISELSLNNVIYKTKKPSVSIIMPVYNSEKYLDDALNDILNQTFKDYELICIDDSSTDKSLSILLKYSKKDKRVFVINKNKENAGAARNLGFQLSRGKYLMFLDSDDRFEPTLLKKMYEDISKKDSDVSICNAIKFDDKTNNEIKSNLILKGRYPDQSPFNHKTIKDNLYLFCTPCPWNKIFKRSLIEDNNIKFQEIPRANDLFFVYYALTKARQISIIEEKLVRYRTGTSSNLQSGNDKSPFAFLKSLIFLKDKLENDGIFNGYIKKSFINMAISVCIYNINSLKKQKNKDIILYWLKKKGLKKLGLIPNEKNFYLYNNDKKIKEYFNVNIK